MKPENCIITKKDGRIFYNRYVHSEMLTLIDSFNKMYGGFSAVFPSGLCAIDSSINCLMNENNWKPVNIICGNELYCDSKRIFKYLETTFPSLVNICSVDITDEKKILEKFEECKNRRIIFYFETCSNPNGNIFRFEFLKELRKTYNNLRVVVDNTWITSVLFNPLKYVEVDIVVNSLTKYYGAGKSGILGISICRKKELCDMLFDYGRIKGLHVSPIYCKEVLYHLRYVKERIEKSSKMTLDVINKLLLNKVEIIYPKLSNHKSFELAKKYFGNLGPSVFTFVMLCKRNVALEIMKKSKIECSTSFGSATSRFDSWPISKKKKTICRLSVGYDDNVDDIVEKFLNMIKKLGISIS